jgi:hypothetical protein
VTSNLRRQSRNEEVDVKQEASRMSASSSSHATAARFGAMVAALVALRFVTR